MQNFFATKLGRVTLEKAYILYICTYAEEYCFETPGWYHILGENTKNLFLCIITKIDKEIHFRSTIASLHCKQIFLLFTSFTFNTTSQAAEYVNN